MNLEQFSKCFESWWEDVAKYTRDAITFLDDATAECLHWHGGLKKMLSYGATGVKMFSPFEKADPDQRKAVFIVSAPLYGETLRTLMTIIRACSFKHCIVITSLPEKCNAAQSLDTEQCFLHLENQIISWMGNMNYIAAIRHIPLFAAALNEELILMPSFSRTLSLYNCGLMEANSKRANENFLKNLSPDFQASIKCFVGCLNTMFEELKMKIDVFSLGPLSHIVGSELENLSHLQKKKVYSSKTSVLIIDRTLDLSGPLSQSTESLYDSMLRSLPHLPGHVFDVAVSMNELCSSKNDQVFCRQLLAPGCIAHKNKAAEASSLNSFLYNKPREALIDINRKIVEAAVKENISVNPASRVTAEALLKMILSFKEKPSAMLSHVGLVQQALAVAQALSHTSNSNTDKLVATEKALMQYLTTSGEEMLKNIIQMVSEKEKLNLSLEEILIFVAFFYELSENVHLNNESAAQASIMEAFFQDSDEIKELVAKFVADGSDDDSILTAVKIFFHVLKRLSTVRKGLKKYSSIFKSVNPAFPATYNPLLKQVLEDIFNPAVSEVPDIVFHSAGIKDYIKSSFSLFVNVSRLQPRDNPLMILIVLGGITPSEIKLVHEISSRQKHNKVIIGCTNVLTPTDVLKDLGLIVKELSSKVYEDYDL